MFIPNMLAFVTRVSGKNIHGEIQFEEDGEDVPCAIVRFIDETQKTTVRADSSASRGNSNEVVADVKMLFVKTYRPTKDSKVVVAGNLELRVVSVHPRIAIVGGLDHYEVDLVHWV